MRIGYYALLVESNTTRQLRWVVSYWDGRRFDISLANRGIVRRVWISETTT